MMQLQTDEPIAPTPHGLCRSQWLVLLVALVLTALGLRQVLVHHALLRQVERVDFSDCRSALIGRDEGNYMRMADEIRRGERPTDDVYDAVSYRSVLFAAAAVPMIAKLGCTGEALDALRSGVLVLRLLIPVAGFTLLLVVGGRAKLEKACLAMTVLAWNSQLTSSSYFLPDVPSALLVIVCLLALAVARRPVAAAATGALLATAVLVKADFLYMFLAVLGVRVIVASRSKLGLRPAVLALTAYLAVIGGWACRNHSLTGSFFVTSKDSVILWIGNDEESRSHGFRYHLVTIPDAVRDAHAGESVEVWGRRYFYAKLWERVCAHPLEVAGGVVAKTWLYLTNGEENNHSYLGVAGVWIGRLINVLAAAAALLWVIRRLPESESPARGDMVLAWASGFAILAATIYEARYMVHVLTLAAVLASWFAVDVVLRVRSFLGLRMRIA